MPPPASVARSASVSLPPSTLRHPAPDLQSLQGSYVRNVEKLERSAEEMSQDGSDLGEEIRRTYEAEKSRSRQNSIQSSHQGEASVVRPSVLERMSSTRSSRASSNGHSIVDVNGAARWGGYSPAAYITSPVGSTSGSWAHPSVSRVPSGAKPSRMALANESTQDAPSASSAAGPSHLSEQQDESQSSFARQYDAIAGQIGESSAEDADTTQKITPPDRPRSTDTFQEAQLAFKDFDGVHFSPDTDEFVEVDEHGNELRRVSARSSSGGLSFAAASLLRAPRSRPMSYAEPPPEESMVYYPAPVPRMLNLPKRLSQLPSAAVQAKRRSQMLSELPPEARASAPWLGEAANRGPSGHSRGSGSSGSQPRGLLNERMSANLNNLPPQLRASMFFDRQSVQQDVEVKNESAVATLDSILKASATAPVSVFTDHPYAGDVRRTVYSPEPPPRRSTNLSSSSPGETKSKRRRSSSIGGLLKRNTSTDESAENSKRRGSRASILGDLEFNEGGKKLQKRKSVLSLGDELDQQSETLQTPGNERSEPDLGSGLIAAAQNATPSAEEHRISRPASALGQLNDADQIENDADQIENDFKEEEAQEDVEDDDAYFVQPSTLLAELQVRKAQQKSRNRTAATAFPNGMHSTLLQLDAVEEINKRKRKAARINLAWEDPNQRALDAEKDEDDEDVPLGMLFPSKDGLTNRKVGDARDWDRPLGLMEKRELEDNEPLASRRNRLRGTSPSKGRASSPDRRAVTTPLPNASQLHLAGQPDVPAEDQPGEDEGETLAQRMRRMKTKDALDTAISGVAAGDDDKRSTFADDLLSQFGGLKGKDAAGASPQIPTSPGAQEEETLGQRRARLQREREASGELRNISGGSEPLPIRPSTSMANLLSTNPVGQRKLKHELQPAQGTLLDISVQQQAKQRSQLASTNMRSSSYGLDKPLVNARPQTSREASTGGLLGREHNSRAPTGGFAAGAYNNGSGGIQSAPLPAQTPMSAPAFGVNNATGYFASQTAMPYGNGYAGSPMTAYPQMMMPMQQPAFAQPMSPLAFGGGMPMASAGGYMGNAGMVNGTYASYAQQGIGAPGMMGMPMGMAYEEPMNTQQREVIDRWRMSIAP